MAATARVPTDQDGVNGTKTQELVAQNQEKTVQLNEKNVEGTPSVQAVNELHGDWLVVSRKKHTQGPTKQVQKRTGVDNNQKKSGGNNFQDPKKAQVSAKVTHSVSHKGRRHVTTVGPISNLNSSKKRKQNGDPTSVARGVAVTGQIWVVTNGPNNSVAVTSKVGHRITHNRPVMLQQDPGEHHSGPNTNIPVVDNPSPSGIDKSGALRNPTENYTKLNIDLINNYSSPQFSEDVVKATDDTLEGGKATASQNEVFGRVPETPNNWEPNPDDMLQ